MHHSNFFSQSYAEARCKFLAACTSLGVSVQSFVHDGKGRDDEELAMDVARIGSKDARELLVISSGCHGVEGFCGSGVQIALLNDAALLTTARETGIALLFVHGINPYGFSWWRRTTRENVDLNRNFIDFSQPQPRNTRYDEIAELLVPQAWPPTEQVQQALYQYIATHGQRVFQEVVSSGQYHRPDGLFFGGQKPTWSQSSIRQVLREYAQTCEKIGWIDLHSGLGPSGHGEKIFAGRDEDLDALRRARSWWSNVVTATYDGSSTSSRLSGLMLLATYEECPQAQSTAMTLEYGTLPIMDILHALRSEQWLENHPKADAATRDAIKKQMRDAFYVDTDEWKTRIVDQGFDATRAALAGLARSTDSNV